MSTVNYSLKNRGVRLLDAREAWVVSKKGVPRLNSRYRFLGKVETTMPNMVVTASDKRKLYKKRRTEKDKNAA